MKNKDKETEKDKKEDWFMPMDDESMRAMQVMNCLDTMLFIDKNRGGWIYNKLVGKS